MYYLRSNQEVFNLSLQNWNTLCSMKVYNIDMGGKLRHERLFNCAVGGKRKWPLLVTRAKGMENITPVFLIIALSQISLTYYYCIVLNDVMHI